MKFFGKSKQTKPDLTDRLNAIFDYVLEQNEQQLDKQKLFVTKQSMLIAVITELMPFINVKQRKIIRDIIEQCRYD